MDGAGQTTQLLTDSAGRTLTHTDPLGHRTRYAYNLFNQVQEIVDAQKGATTLTYDGNGNLRTLTDARNNVTEYTYDVTALSPRDARAGVGPREHLKKTGWRRASIRC